MSELQKETEQRLRLRAAITELVDRCVHVKECEPGKWWALINLPGLSSKTIYTGVIEGHAKMLAEVARVAMIHALNYSVLTAQGTAEAGAEVLMRNGFIHIGKDFLRNADEIASAIAALNLPATPNWTAPSRQTSGQSDFSAAPIADANETAEAF